MFSAPVFTFESRYHLRRPTFWVIALVFFAIALTDMVSKGSEGNAFFYVNSPLQIFQTTIWYTIFGILAAAAFVAETFVRDPHHRTEELMLATPIRKSRYLATRFWAAFGMALLAFSAYLPGMVMGSLLPGLNPYAIGPLRLDAYVLSYLLVAVPNLFLVSAIAFGLAARTRSLAITYAGAIMLVMFYLASLLMVGADVVNFEQYRLWALADPFGFYALEEQALAWTVHQYNTLMPPIGSTVIANRLLWLVIALGIWLSSYVSYSLQLPTRHFRRRRRSPATSPAPTQPRPADAGTTPLQGEMVRRFWGYTSSGPDEEIRYIRWKRPALKGREQIRQWLYRSRFETSLILQGRAFLLLTAGGLVSLVMAALGSRSFNYSNPSTDILIHSANLYFEYILFAIIVVYAAEVMWRDRTLRLQAVIDATPVSNGVLLLSKLAALFVIITLNLLLAMVVLIGYQLLNGYTNLQVPLYLQMLFLEHGPYFYITAALALFTQVVTRRKYLGMALVVLISLSHIPLDALGWYHNLYRFAATNDIEYSPMNGYGGLFVGHLWYVLYWGLFAAVLMLLAYIVWPRGLEQGNLWRTWQQGWQQAHRTVQRSLAGLLLLWAGVGTWIGYNTIVVNPYQPAGKEETAAAIETRFKQYENLPMPVVTDTQLTVELYPDQRYFQAAGQYTLANRTDQPIQEIHLLTFINLKLEAVDYPGATLREAHPEWGYYIYDLATPLQPGEQQVLQFQTATAPAQGFRNQVNSDDVYMIYPNDVVYNGTNLYSPFILPFVGYTKMVEHKQAWLRESLGLPPLGDRMRPHDDPTGLAQALMVTHLDWGSTDITIGIAGNQTAVTAGRLVDSWVKGDRAYFRYQSTTPTRSKFTIFSARYDTYRTDDYRVPIEIYYHPQHAENVALIAEQVGDALTFYEDTFGPYPFEQVRVAEFVYYDGMVFSDGGTLGIPEVLVWKSEVTGAGHESLVDWVSYLLAQSWWEDQLIAADVAGGMTIREALSAYASELYQRSRRAPEEQRLAKQQLMRNYFRQLGKIDSQEPPLEDIYNELNIARFKGGMTLELIEQQIGQDALLTGIRNFLADHRYQASPYATILDLRDAIVAQAPESDRPLINELFAEVITYQVGITDATYEPVADGQYRVQLDVATQKLITTDLGQQTAERLTIPVVIALQNSDGEVIYEAEHAFEEAASTVEIMVNEPPGMAAIDPNYTLPSSFLPDNTKPIRPLRN
ncbi:MAG: peptidase [Cyanobacteria bacterium P01_F01_bin.56]